MSTVGLKVAVIGLWVLAAQGQPVQYRLNTASTLTKSPTIAVDVDQDGRVDLVAAEDTEFNQRLLWLRNLGGVPPEFETLDIGDRTASGSSMPFLAAEDMDGDGDVDFVFTTVAFFGNSSRLYLVEQTDDDADQWPRRTLPSTERMQDLRLADLDGDGHVDIITLQNRSETNNTRGLRWYRNDGATPPSFIEQDFRSVSNAPELIEVGDLNGDGKLDVVFATGNSSSPLLVLNQSAASVPGAIDFDQRFQNASAGSEPSFGYDALLVVDIDQDGLPEIVAGDTSETAIWSFDSMASSGLVFQRELISPTPFQITDADALVADDVDGDGDVDILLNTDDAGYIVQLRNDGWPAMPLVPVNLGLPISSPDFRIGQAADVDGDGDTDLIIVEGESTSTTSDLTTSRWLERTLVQNQRTLATFSTLQDAIDAASAGDTILADPGAFGDPAIDLAGKALTLESTGGVRTSAGGVLTLAPGASIDADFGESIAIDGDVALETPGTATLAGDAVVVRRAPALGPGAVLQLDGVSAALEANEQFRVRTFFERTTPSETASIRPGLQAWGDINDDGLLDLALATFGRGGPGDPYAIRIIETLGSIDATAGSLIEFAGFDGGDPALVDLDLDGRLDLATSLDDTGEVRWQRNLGPAGGPGTPTTFAAPQVLLTGGAGVTSRGVADIDQDGFDDLLIGGDTHVLARAGGPLVVGPTTPGGTGNLYAVTDLNGDGVVDLVFTPGFGFGTISVSYGLGTSPEPTFGPGTNIPLIVDGFFQYSTLNPAAGDFDLDGDIDLAGVNSFENDLVVFLNDGEPNPSFVPVIVDGGPVSGELAAADFDLDGDVDIVSTRLGLTVFRNDLGSPPSFSRVELPGDFGTLTSAIVDDFTGDGRPDSLLLRNASCSVDTGACEQVLIVEGRGRIAAQLDAPGSRIESLGPLQIGRGAVAVGVGAELVAPKITLLDAGAATTESVTLAGAGTVRADVIENAGTIVADLAGGLTIAGQLRQTVASASRAGRIRVALESAADVGPGVSIVPGASASAASELAGALVITPSPQFDPSALTQPIEVVSSAEGIAGTFDAVLVAPALAGDQFLTVDYGVTPRPAGRSSGTVSLGVASLSGDPELAPPTGFTTPGAPTDAVTADVNNDSFDDVVLVIPGAGGAGGNLTLLISDGVGGFAQQITVPTAIDPRGVAVGDIDQAGGLDIAVTGFGDDTVRVYSTDGAATPSVALESTLGVAELPLLSEPFDIVVGQFNGTGPDDVALTSSGSDVIYLLETKEDPMMDPFEFEPCEVPAGTRPKNLAAPALADLDADGMVDFLVGNAAQGGFGVSVITSAGGFSVTTFPLGDEPGELLLRDFNGDGEPDGVVVRPDGDVLSVLRNTGVGVFAPPADLPVGVAPRSLAAADLDTDGDADLAVVTGIASDRVVRLLRNDTQSAGQLVFASTDQIEVADDTSLVRAGDLDADGREDLVSLSGASTSFRSKTQEGGAVLLNPGPCVADVTTDGTSNGVPDGEVTLSDFSYYLTLWSARDSIADVTTDGSANGVPDGGVTLSDFSYYLGLWSAGCP